MFDPNPEEKKSDVPAPWDDEVYTDQGVEYRTIYPITPETEKKDKDDEDN